MRFVGSPGRLTLFIPCVATCLALGMAAFVPSAHADGGASWDSRGAAAYLDKRMSETAYQCMSCHTAFPFALARRALRGALDESRPSASERQLLDNVRERVRHWREAPPILGDKERGPATESVLNALILVSYDAPNRTLGDDTRQALNTMWALQLKSGERAGAWPWFGDGGGGEEPWEAYDSQYWGAALAAVAVGTLPPEYQSAPEIQGNLKLLKGYLQRGRHTQSLLNRLSLLWADEKWPGLLTAGQKASVVQEVLSRQRTDGGWSAADLVASSWRRLDGTPQETKSDGFATGMAAFVIRGAGVAGTRSATESAKSWLVRNQDRISGAWRGYSLNKQRDPASDVGKFMSDAATAYSVLALTQGN